MCKAFCKTLIPGLLALQTTWFTACGGGGGLGAPHQAPAITSANTTAFTAGSAGSFAITATGFPAPTLSESGALPSGVIFTAPTGTLSGTPAANSAGTYKITFTASNGIAPNATQNFTLAVNNPVPVLLSISPVAANAGAGNTKLTVGGSNFTAQSVVHADATSLTTTFVSSTQLTATLPAWLLTSTGTLTVTVVSPAPGGGPSTGLTFKIWPTYPRSGAGSVLGTAPALTRIPLNGTLFSVLDWTSKDSDSSDEDVLAADHALAPMGIPNIDTTNLAAAAANRFLMVAGVLDTASKLSAAEVSALITYVQNGGTLYLWAPSVSSLLTALGLAGQTSYSGSGVGALRPLTIDEGKVDPLLTYIDDPAEINWQLNVPTASVTIGYAAGSCTPLATWNNSGDYALLRCDIGTGRAYVFGWRLRVSITLPEREIVPGIEPPSTNAVVLDADISRLLMRGSYEGLAADPQIRQFAPAGHQAALIIMHDVDATVSYDNVPAYADLETSLGIKSTFLFATNPYNNGWIGPMYVASGIEQIQYALDRGFDVESHSFGHFPDFKLAPYGTGSESASNYVPKYTETPPGSHTCCTSGMSVIGELGVSRWLLENDFGISVESFRSGYLQIPPSFVKGLGETGYRRDTTFASGLTRGSFPFVGFELVSGKVMTTSVMEYPLAISDDEIDAANYSQFLDQWEAVIRANYANNAPTILLIHPVNTGIQLQALQDILTRVSDLDLWIGDWKTFAHFWEAQGVTNARWP